MVERKTEPPLTATLKALCDTTRRDILTLVAQQGPLRVTDLAQRFPVSLNAVSKHIKVLEAAGLVTRQTDWREHLITARLEPLGEIRGWMTELRSIWEIRLEGLEDALADNAAKEGNDP